MASPPIIPACLEKIRPLVEFFINESTIKSYNDCGSVSKLLYTMLTHANHQGIKLPPEGPIQIKYVQREVSIFKYPGEPDYSLLISFKGVDIGAVYGKFWYIDPPSEKLDLDEVVQILEAIPLKVLTKLFLSGSYKAVIKPVERANRPMVNLTFGKAQTLKVELSKILNVSTLVCDLFTEFRLTPDIEIPIECSSNVVEAFKSLLQSSKFSYAFSYLSSCEEFETLMKIVNYLGIQV